MTYSLQADKRVLGTQSTLKTTRKESKVPAILYSRAKASTPLTLDSMAFAKILKSAGESSLIELSIDKGQMVNVLIKEVQRHPVTDRIIHADLYEINMNEKVKAEVKVVFNGEAPAVKEKGANLVISIDHLEVECLPKDLPHEIAISLESLIDIGDSIQIKDIKVPTGVEILDDGDATLVSVAAVREEKFEAVPTETVIAESIKQKTEGATPGEPEDKKDDKKKEKE